MAAGRTYRDLTPDKPFTCPTFHAVLRGSLKGRGGVYTVHDVAFVDFICDAFLRQVNLQKKSASSGFDKTYREFVATARQVEGQNIQGDATAPAIKIVRGTTNSGKGR